MLCKSKKALMLQSNKPTLHTRWLDDHNGISYTWGPKIAVPCIIILSDILDQIMGCVASSSISVIQTGVIRYELKLLHMWYSKTIFSRIKTCSLICQPLLIWHNSNPANHLPTTRHFEMVYYIWWQLDMIVVKSFLNTCIFLKRYENDPTTRKYLNMAILADLLTDLEWYFIEIFRCLLCTYFILGLHD